MAPLHAFLLPALLKVTLPLLLSGLTVIIVIFIVVILKELGVMPAMRQQVYADRNAVLLVEKTLLGFLTTPLHRFNKRQKQQADGTGFVVSSVSLTCCCILQATSCKA